jgi:ABC-type antimicrobial peptide transport system permease subunit
VLQVALVFAIGAQAVTSAALLHRIARANVGLATTGLVVASVQTGDHADVDPHVRLARYNAVIADLGRRGIPAAFTHTFPLTSSDYLTAFGERRSRSARRPMLRTRLVTPSYFDLTRTRPMSGRVLTSADAGSRHAVVNDVYAATQGGADAVLGLPIGPNGRWTVVGVVPAVRQTDFYEQPKPEAYVLYDDFIALRSTSAAATLTSDYLVADARAGVPATLAALRQSLAAEAPDVRIDQTSSLDELIDLRLGAKRLVAAGAITFAVIALLLAAIGLHAMVSHGLALRRLEIGIRLALGATPGRIVMESAAPVVVTSTAGVAAGVAMLLMERALLHAALLPPPGVTTPSLAGVTVVSAAVLFASLALACYRPVRHASEVDPAIVLRGE